MTERRHIRICPASARPLVSAPGEHRRRYPGQVRAVARPRIPPGRRVDDSIADGRRQGPPHGISLAARPARGVLGMSGLCVSRRACGDSGRAARGRWARRGQIGAPRTPGRITCRQSRRPRAGERPHNLVEQHPGLRRGPFDRRDDWLRADYSEPPRQAMTPSVRRSLPTPSRTRIRCSHSAAKSTTASPTTRNISVPSHTGWWSTRPIAIPRPASGDESTASSTFLGSGLRSRLSAQRSCRGDRVSRMSAWFRRASRHRPEREPVMPKTAPRVLGADPRQSRTLLNNSCSSRAVLWRSLSLSRASSRTSTCTWNCHCVCHWVCICASHWPWCSRCS